MISYIYIPSLYEIHQAVFGVSSENVKKNFKITKKSTVNRSLRSP